MHFRGWHLIVYSEESGNRGSREFLTVKSNRSHEFYFNLYKYFINWFIVRCLAKSGHSGVGDNVLSRKLFVIFL